MNRSWTLLAIALFCLAFAPVAHSQQVRDPKKGSESDVLVVPKGTRIQTDISHSVEGTPVTPYRFEGKIEIPVRLGFTTAIPASAKITVLVTSRTYQADYQDRAETIYQEYVELLNVTIDGKIYDITTDRIQMQAGTAKSVAFTLLEPLEIRR